MGKKRKTKTIEAGNERTIPLLHFTGGGVGWVESYRPVSCKPLTRNEHEVLKKYSDNGGGK